MDAGLIDAGVDPALCIVNPGAFCKGGFPQCTDYTCSGLARNASTTTFRFAFRDDATSCFHGGNGPLYLREYIANSLTEATGCAQIEVEGCAVTTPYAGSTSYFCYDVGSTTSAQELSDSEAHARTCVGYRYQTTPARRTCSW